jgi:hypothetical protein
MSISIKDFESRVAAQKKNNQSEIMKWRDLEEGKLYEIVFVEYMKTKFGSACVIILSNGDRVFASSMLKKEIAKTLETREWCFPCFVRPNGKIESKRNPGQYYFSFDMVWTPQEDISESDEEGFI